MMRNNKVVIEVIIRILSDENVKYVTIAIVEDAMIPMLRTLYKFCSIYAFWKSLTFEILCSKYRIFFNA